MKLKLLSAAVIALSLNTLAQSNPQTTLSVEPMDYTPTFHVTVPAALLHALPPEQAT